MRTRRARAGRVAIGLLLLGVAALGLVPAATAAAHASPARSAAVWHNSVTSTNWAGYAVTGSNVTDVKGSWIEPKIQGTCPTAKNEYASFWVGIDGYSSATVEQTGTDSDCQGGSPTYYAWYEAYPNPSHLISTLTISAGDKISAEVKYSFSTHKFTLTLKDVTKAKSFSTAVSVSGAKRNSAEWIAEAPSSSSGILPLANFGTVSFGTDYTAVASTNYATIAGHTGKIGSFLNIHEITMINNAGTKTKAKPSSLSADGTSFQVTWKSAGP
jgi:hypothetical protein